MEIWKDIIGYEGLYKVSNLGRVKSLEKKIKYRGGKQAVRKEKIMSLSDRVGYLSLILVKDGKKSVKKAHRLVAEAFLEKEEGRPWVNHKDGDTYNNNLENLEWCSPSENAIHAIETGLWNTKRKTVLTNIETGEVLKFDSRKQASMFLTGHPTNLGKKVYGNKNKYMGYLVTNE